MPDHFLFLVASTREADQFGNTEWLAKQAAANLPTTTSQQWINLATTTMTPFVDVRHTVGKYPRPSGTLEVLLEATMQCTDLVLVAPVYWYSFPNPLKLYLDHWSAWLRIDGLPFKEAMSKKRMHLITTNGDQAKAQPMIESAKLCAEFLSMNFVGVLWGKGGLPRAVESDTSAVNAAKLFFKASAA